MLNVVFKKTFGTLESGNRVLTMLCTQGMSLNVIDREHAEAIRHMMAMYAPAKAMQSFSC
jgi:hypothetical protein